MHWAYKKPVRPKVPVIHDASHPVDAFIREALVRKGVAPSPPAEPGILLRRLSLALVGLPPTLTELDSFESNYDTDRSKAVRLAIDRLLASPQFGERWARPWLDAARYADSHGFQRDDLRDLWPFRDWVIRALNENMPFDQFTIRQIAGDLLVQRAADRPLTDDETALLVATGFNRCAPTNVEAGTDQEEGRVHQVFDRVNTTATVWLGLTLECAQCHDHKYDPFTMRDYYGVFAFFNNTPRETELLNEKAQAALRFTGPYLELRNDPATSPDIEISDENPNGAPSKKGDIRHYLRTLVMQELDSPRGSHVLNRGDFLQPGEAVAPATPKLFDKLPEAPANRLGFAQWLVSPQNPLMARVIVNRFWAEMFGRGIVGTPEDFGSRGDPPTHPELLDWLAVEFEQSGWNVKHMLRLIATSETFQQSARVRSDAARLDPANQLLWRYPRLRLDAEGIRDNALAIAGLLSLKQFGPPVRPPQPDGLWRKVGGDAYNYQPSPGEDRYRRGIYVIRRRSALHPALAAFDAPARTACVVQRSVSNTPLQALVLLNDPVYVEAASALGELIRRSPGMDADRLRMGFRICTSRHPEPIELDALTQLLSDSRQAYAERNLTRPNRRAWMDVAAALLNLDETVCIP